MCRHSRDRAQFLHIRRSWLVSCPSCEGSEPGGSARLLLEWATPPGPRAVGFGARTHCPEVMGTSIGQVPALQVPQ